MEARIRRGEAQAMCDTEYAEEAGISAQQLAKYPRAGRQHCRGEGTCSCKKSWGKRMCSTSDWSRPRGMYLWH